MYCRLYTTAAVAPYGTLYSAVYSGVTYNLTYSYGYALSPADSGVIRSSTSSTSTKTTSTSSVVSSACTAMAAASTAYTDANGVAYKMSCGRDLQYIGDLGSQAANSYYNCFAGCDNFQGCQAFTYFQGACYFKSLVNVTTGPSENSAVDLAYLPSAYTGTVSAVQTIQYTTVTIGWTGTTTTTSVQYGGLTATVYVETPTKSGTGATTKATTVTYTTITTDSGTATTPSTTTITPAAGNTLGTVRVVYPTPITTCNNAGVRFAMYSNPFVYSKSTSTSTSCSYRDRCTTQLYLVSYMAAATTSYPYYTPEAFKTISPTATGVASYLAEYNTQNQNSVTMYGQTLNPQALTADHTFYIFAKMDGYYSFNLPSCDDIVFVWLGSKALNGWTRANADMAQYYSSTTSTPTTLSYYLNTGDYLPFRVQFGNGGGIGDLEFNVYDPTGSLVMYSSPGNNVGTLTPAVVQNPCNAKQGAAFPAWSSET